ncbi:MAG: bifunctional phosphopantothenoylcysteine decarboxylase/phosphopantothenate--cysteine ligase CoaBC [Pasteurellales bacterium]|nr:MAG: bifunctional phosphopantothenoylcysteine decarboxylase/phosphopantothenate--cysteine ligase CoaBC [Pasteurellales bacterium]
MIVMLANKNILIAISGGIAAYKSIFLIRLLKKHKANVKVVLTKSAQNFVTPTTLQAISGNSVFVDRDEQNQDLVMEHIDLAKWADLICIAPATANTIAKINLGIADNLLTSTILATEAPVIIAPAMNKYMYKRSSFQRNLQNLMSEENIFVLESNQGEQACGDVGLGRMQESEEIFNYINNFFNNSKEFLGIKVAITAGPTVEKIDPVRFLSNNSSGKMGYALAKSFAQKGADVTLISGPVLLDTPNNVSKISVESADEMYQASMDIAKNSDIFIACAAVADFKIAKLSNQKIKKNSDVDTLTLNLVKNPDIVKSVANLTEDRPFVVGFAAETENVLDYAKAKLKSKNLNMICANDVSNNKVFNQDINQITVLYKDKMVQFDTMTKEKLANKLADLIVTQWKEYE